MIVRSLKEVLATEHDVVTETWNSRRLLLAKDGLGFSLHDTLVHPGVEIKMCYLNHLEAVYCIEGEGEVGVLPDGPTHPILPGTVYALDQHDHHVLRATTRMRMVCVFNPPVTGNETHDENGAYPSAAVHQHNQDDRVLPLTHDAR